MRLTRRQLLAGTGGTAAALSFPAVLRAQAKPYAGQTLTVFTYAGAYEATLRKHLVGPFEQRTGPGSSSTPAGGTCCPSSRPPRRAGPPSTWS